MNNGQKFLLIALVVLAILGGYLLFNPPAAQPLGFVFSYSPNPVWVRQAGGIDHFRSYNGGKVQMYLDTAGLTRTVKIDGATGIGEFKALTITDNISLTGAYVGITPVATATAVPTATPQPTYAYVAPTAQPTSTPNSYITRVGSGASYVSGALITNSFAVTATQCFSPQFPISTTYTITSTGFSANFALAGAFTWQCVGTQ